MDIDSMDEYERKRREEQMQMSMANVSGDGKRKRTIMSREEEFATLDAILSQDPVSVDSKPPLKSKHAAAVSIAAQPQEAKSQLDSTTAEDDAQESIDSIAKLIQTSERTPPSSSATRLAGGIPSRLAAKRKAPLTPMSAGIHQSYENMIKEGGGKDREEDGSGGGGGGQEEKKRLAEGEKETAESREAARTRRRERAINGLHRDMYRLWRAERLARESTELVKRLKGLVSMWMHRLGRPAFIIEPVVDGEEADSDEDDELEESGECQRIQQEQEEEHGGTGNSSASSFLHRLNRKKKGGAGSRTRKTKKETKRSALNDYAFGVRLVNRNASNQQSSSAGNSKLSLTISKTGPKSSVALISSLLQDAGDPFDEDETSSSISDEFPYGEPEYDGMKKFVKRGNAAEENDEPEAREPEVRGRRAKRKRKAVEPPLLEKATASAPAAKAKKKRRTKVAQAERRDRLNELEKMSMKRRAEEERFKEQREERKRRKAERDRLKNTS